MYADLRPNSARRPRKPLIARGGIARTFGSLGGFLALTFFCSGAYLFADAFSNPLAAESTSLIGGAVILALATVLLFYILHPSKPARLRMRNFYREDQRSHHRRSMADVSRLSYPEAQHDRSIPSAPSSQPELPFHAAACAEDHAGSALKAFQARGMAGK